MGIEVVGFSSARHIARRHSDRRCDLDEHYIVGPECKLLDGYKPGCYEHSVDFTFSISYAEFDTWQDALSRIVLGIAASDVVEDENRFLGQPFVELIALPCANDLGIGPRTSAKLYRDFVRNSASVKSGFQHLAAEAALHARKGRKPAPRKRSRTARTAESIAKALGGTAVGGDGDVLVSRWEWTWKLYRDFREAFWFARDDGMVILSI